MLRLLGPVELVAGGQVLEFGPPQQRLVVAALAVAAGRTITIETLIDRVWDEAPTGARRTVHVLIARLRRQLEQAGASGEVPVSVVRRSGGYLLQVDAEQVDAHRFRRLVDQAGECTGRDDERVALLREALALWRGEALSGLGGQWAAQIRHVWLQDYLQAVVHWADAETRIGNEGAVLGTLTGLVGEHPLAESLTVALMRALHGTGRSAEALACAARIRARLADEFGADPGAELQELHQEILRAGHPAPRPAVSRPAQLPADVPGFTGREPELARLHDLLGSPDTVAISAVSGTAGVGKTALVVHWAHQVRERFPDGQLYVNLRGYDPGQPMAPADALAGFLTALGVAGSDLPPGLDERAARFRTEVADRRILVVLDNASTVEQVRPLLPGMPGSVVLVTSRDRLGGLVAAHGAQRVEIGLLPPGEARTLLRLLIGVRVDAEPESAAELARLCAWLPLALRVAAYLAVSLPATPLAELVADLSDLAGRLDLLDAGDDPHTEVRAVFSWSMRQLSTTDARVFTLLGIHPGPDLELHAVAALAGTGLDRTRRTLDALTRAHLVQRTGAGRYQMHDLLRAYAADLAVDTDAPLDRLFDYYLAATASAVGRMYPAEAHHRPRLHAVGAALPALPDLAAARAWLNSERDCLTAIAAYGDTQGRAGHVVELSAMLFRYLVGGHTTDALSVHGHARSAARRTGDRAGEARALLGIGATFYRLGRHDAAADHYKEALDLFRQAGDRTGEARAVGNLGIAQERLGRYASAAEYHQAALDIFVEVGDRTGEARALNNLGIVEMWLGRFDVSIAHQQRSLSLCRQVEDQIGAGDALTAVGLAEIRVGRWESAADHLTQALTLFRQVGHRTGEAWALDSFGTLHTALGEGARGRDCHLEALALFRHAGDRDGQTWALNGLGDAARLAGDFPAALQHHTAALVLAERVGTPDQRARAVAGLEHANRELGMPLAGVSSLS